MEERVLSTSLLDEPFEFKEGEEDWLNKINPTPIGVKFEVGDTLKMHRIIAAKEGARLRREVLQSPLSEEEKQDRIYQLYKWSSEDSGFHPKTLRVGPKNLRWLAELAVVHKRTLDYVLDRVVEAARYGIPYEIKAEICSRSASAIASVQHRKAVEQLAADLLREEIEKCLSSQEPTSSSASDDSQTPES